MWVPARTLANALCRIFPVFGKARPTAMFVIQIMLAEMTLLVRYMLMVLVQRGSNNSKRNWQFRSEHTELQQGHHQEAPQEMQVAFTVPCKG